MQFKKVHYRKVNKVRSIKIFNHLKLESSLKKKKSAKCFYRIIEFKII